jgi:hypothetical protein
MKKTVRVTITKDIEIDIDDDCLTEEAIIGFEGCMFDLDEYGDVNKKIENLFCYTAKEVFDTNSTFIVGVGYAIQDYMKKFSAEAEIIFNYNHGKIESKIV